MLQYSKIYCSMYLIIAVGSAKLFLICMNEFVHFFNITKDSADNNFYHDTRIALK